MKLAVAKCKKMKGVMVQMKKQIALAVKRTAEGRDPDGVQMQSTLAKDQEKDAIKSVRKEAHAACLKAKTTLQATLANPSVSAQKKAFAKTQTEQLCAKVKQLVEQEVTKIKSQVAATTATAAAKDGQGSSPAVPGSMPPADATALKNAVAQMRAHEADSKAQ